MMTTQNFIRGYSCFPLQSEVWLMGSCMMKWKLGVSSLSLSGTPILRGNQPLLGLTLVLPGLEPENAR